MARKILVADDDQEILDLLQELLQGEDYRVALASNGKEALEAVQNTPIDVAILDMRMPVMDGVEALEKIREFDQKVVALIMTGHGDVDSLKKSVGDYGAHDYIIKPFHRADIIQTVRSALLKRDFLIEEKRLREELEDRIAQLEKDFEQRTVQLRESQLKYKQVIDNSNDAIIVAQDGRLRFVNPKALELTGYDREELLELPFVDLIHPDDRAMVEQRHLGTLKEEDFASTYPFRALRKNGESFWVENNSIRTTWEGKPAALNVLRDITERKHAEEALRESEEKFRLIAETSTDDIFQIGSDGIVTYASPAVKDIFGYTMKETIGKPFQEFFLEEEIPRAENVFKNVLSGKPEKLVEFAATRKDGSVFPIEVSVAPLVKENEVVGVQGVARDITERKQAEEALRESEERYRTLVENLPVAAYRNTPGPEGKFLMANPAFLNMFGFDTMEELQEVSPANLYVNAEERKAFSDRLLEEGSVSEVELQLRRKDGAPVWGAVTARVGSKQGGEPAYFDCIIVDITDRKRAEEALEESEERARALLNAITETAILIDAQGTVLASNETLAKRLGRSLDELVGIRLYDLFPPEIAEARKEAADHVFRTGEPLRTTDEREGRVYDIHWYPILDAQGEVAQLAVFASDITEKRKLEEERLKAEKLESIGILAGGIAHDFNNILAAIIGNISLAKLDLDRRDRIFELLEEAERASSRAQALTRQLLTFSKGGAPVRKAASVSEVIKESSTFALRGSKARCDFSLPDSLWPADIDVGQINQVIHNLILNADQAMPKGGLIQVRAGNVVVEPAHGLPLEPGRYVEISVQDQGTGILEEHLPKVFDPYFTTKHKGSGLGLATAYAIVKRHDGHIAVESELGVGTTFHIYLPASEKEAPESKEERGKPIVGKGKVLVMDDEGMVRNVAKQMLSRIGYETEVAGDGAEAIELYKKAKELREPFDAVILDLTVPGGMGGRDAIKLLKQIDPEVKGIVSSGYFNDPIMSHFKDYGFSGVVAKPYAIEELSKILNETVEKTINKG